MRTPFMKHVTLGWLRASALRPVLMTLLLGSLAACGQQLVQFQDGDADVAANDADGSADIDVAAVPSVISTIPNDGSGNVALQQALSATFNVDMDATSLADAFVVRQGTTILAGSVSVVGATATFVPTDPLPIDAVCTATITDQAKSTAGRPMAAAYQWSFSTSATLDVTAPKLSSTLPAHEASNVALAGTVRATFSEAMDPLTLTAESFLLKRGSAAVAGSVSFDVDNNIAVFTPDAAFEAGTTYSALITAAATDLAGNALEGGLVPSNWTFTTAFAPVVAPTVTSVSPVHATTAVATNVKLTATFDEAMDAASLLVPGAFSVTEGFGTPVAGTVTYDVGSKTATFTPTVDLPHDATISATIGVDVTNLAGVGLVAPYDWQFATHAAPDTTAPLVVFTSPAHGDAAVAFNKVVVATFSEAMNPASIDGTKVTLTGPGGAIAAVVSYAPASFAVTLAPLQPLEPNTLYTLAILAAGGVQDLAGNTLAAAFSADFTTAATPDTEAPKVSSTNPMALAQDVATGQKLSVTFSEAMDPLTMIGPNVVVTSSAGPIAGIVTFDVTNNILHFTPSSPLASGATYTAEVKAEAKDLAGNALIASSVVANPWTFKTIANVVVGPTVTFVAPAMASVGAASNSKILAIFSQPMNGASLTAAGVLVLKDVTGGVVAGSTAYLAASNTLFFTPTSPLANDTIYIVTISTAAKNSAGVAMSEPFVWSFSTASAADATPPTVVFTAPANGDQGVPVNKAIVVTFDEAMDAATIDTGNVSVGGPTGPIAGVVTYAAGSNAATFAPNAALAAGAVHVVTVKGVNGVKDLAGNAMVANRVFSFTTASAPDTTGPKLSSTNPAAIATNVSILKNVSASFTEAMDPKTIVAANFKLTSGATTIDGQLTYDIESNLMTFTPLAPLAPATTYSALLGNGCKDLAGNPLQGGVIPNPWSFTTAAATLPAPTVTFVTPANASVDAAINASITATFSTAMNAATLLAAGTFQVSGPLLAPVAGTLSHDAASKTLTFAPKVPFANATTYVVTIATAAKSSIDVALDQPFVWTFKTAQAPDTQAPTVAFTAPAVNDAGVAVNRKIVATFSESMSALTITAANFSVKGPGGAIAGAVTYAAGSFAATFAPTQALTAATTYEATIVGGTGVKDLAGNAMAASFTWSFKTAAASDTKAPRVSSTSPVHLAEDVTVDSAVSATFSEAMDPLTIGTATFTLMNALTPVVGTVAYDVANNIVTFTPLAPLALNTTYTAHIASGAKDLAGNPLEQGIIANPWTFKTASTIAVAPTVTAVAPNNAATGVAINVKVLATFSMPMDATTVLAIGTVSLRDPQGVEVPAKVSYDAASKTVTLTPDAILEHQTAYTATVTTSAKNGTGTSLATPFVWTFTTSLTPDTTAPLVILTAPIAEEKQVAINRKIVATFNEAMDPLTIIAKNVKVVGPLGPIVGLVSYAAGSSAMTFAPAVPLANSATYTVTIAGTDGVTDQAGNAMKNAYSWTFYTAEKPDTEAPQIVVTNPLDGATNVPVDKKVNATFSEPMDPLTMSTLTFKLSDGSNPVGGTVNYDVLTNIATFSPLNPLKVSTTYTATVGPDAKDLAGNGLAPGVVANGWTFTTAAAPQLGIIIAMGVAEPFAIAATAGVTNTGTTPITHINGDVVLTPDQTCNAVNVGNTGGFGLCGGAAPTINGKVMTNTFPDTTSASAVKDALNAAFLSITPPAGPPAVGSLGGGALIAGPTTLGGLAGGVLVKNDNWFTPGVYKSTTSILITGDLTLDGEGDSNAQFVFQSASSLTTSDGAPSPGARTRILLINGAKASNVWWQVGSSATMGLYAEFQGNVLAAFDITFKTGATSCGRSMAGAWVGGAGAFVFDTNVISIPGNGCPL